MSRSFFIYRDVKNADFAGAKIGDADHSPIVHVGFRMPWYSLMPEYATRFS